MTSLGAKIHFNSQHATVTHHRLAVNLSGGVEILKFQELIITDHFSVQIFRRISEKDQNEPECKLLVGLQT